jgi:two-component system NtrC family sensor kinase
VRRRLAPRLILAITILVLIVKAFSLWVNMRTQEVQLLSSLTRGADQLSRSIVGATWQAMRANRRDDAYQVMTTIAEKQGIQKIRMFNKDGVLMFSTESAEKLHLDKRAEVCSPCHSASSPRVKVDMNTRTRVFRDSNGRRTLAMITPIYNEASCAKAGCHARPSSVAVLGVLDLTIDATHVDQEMRYMRLSALLLTLFELVLISAVVIFFTRRFVEKPIKKLIAGTKAISEMNLDQEMQIDTSEELQQLSHSFEVMRQRLKGAMAENAEFTQQLESKVEERSRQLRVAQQKLVHTDRLASLGQLAASVAHEINNPISGVLNLSMLMQRVLKDDGIPPNRIADFRRYLAQVAGETARVGRIVSDLLAFSRRSKPQTSDADLNAIVRTTVSLVSHKLQLANVTVELHLGETLPSVRCDPSQMQQVVMNLVLNGAEAIKGGGTVTVQTRPSADRQSVVLDISDTGSGMPPEIVRKIFDPFFTTKEEGKGVGLGLAVVYGIVEAHGGDIEVDTAIGQGSTFHVTLPVRPAEAEVPAPTIAVVHSG